MGIKLLWVGLTLIMVAGRLRLEIPAIEVVGAVIMVIGCILMLIDK